jgi:2-dehydro-3-deoxygalactonokinase
MAEPSMLCVDMGTTRTRVWLTQGEKTWGCASGDFGVRDVALGATRDAIEDQLRQLMMQAVSDARSIGLQTLPVCIAAAGMITAPTGLHPLPHLPAPAGASELASAVAVRRFDLNTSLPMYLVTGVAVGAGEKGIDAVLASDLMRGEETLIVGLHSKGVISPNAAVLNLGSHWKWIFLDDASRIMGIRTSLTGEMIHAVQSQTLIASALPQEKPNAFDPEWLQQGAAEAAKNGLSRTGFCVRLLEQAGLGSPEDRLAFLYGAFLQTEVEALRSSGLLSRLDHVCLVGNRAIADAWQRKLSEANIRSTVLGEAERESAYLHGLRELLARHHARALKTVNQ